MNPCDAKNYQTNVVIKSAEILSSFLACIVPPFPSRGSSCCSSSTLRFGSRPAGVRVVGELRLGLETGLGLGLEIRLEF
jgi:hypothetical protein